MWRGNKLRLYPSVRAPLRRPPVSEEIVHIQRDVTSYVSTTNSRENHRTLAETLRAIPLIPVPRWSRPARLSVRIAQLLVTVVLCRALQRHSCSTCRHGARFTFLRIPQQGK